MKATNKPRPNIRVKLPAIGTVALEVLELPSLSLPPGGVGPSQTVSVYISESYESILTVVSEATLAEDGKLDFKQLVNKYGFDVKQYDVVTEDGYILTLFHVPGTLDPVLLFHGIADSSDTFVIRGNTSLIITLAKLGYNLWIGNSRGNLYGRRHVSLNPDTDKKFWDYSFHEVGYYDLAATIDFVCDKTEQDSISVIAHSQGTTAGFVLASTRTEYNEKIKVFIALAPIAFFNHLSPVLFRLFKQVQPSVSFLSQWGMKKFCETMAQLRI
ncbi:lipase 1-like [Leguminivora glycinivorella]|uniref:lipase 1-like n=1 Tax=Leguminivora glycinivorella TaxID=1035111 RepID=UPI002010413A|nr:lipase 1-like [Leguminivora glycinivorella]